MSVSWSRLLGLALLVGLLPLAGRGAVSATEPLVSNLGSPTDPWDSINSDALATAFEIGSSEVLITGVVLRMRLLSTTDEVRIRIAAADGSTPIYNGSPGSMIGTFEFSSPGGDVTGEFEFPATRPFLLRAHTRYWIEVDGDDPFQVNPGIWFGQRNGLVNSGTAGEALQLRMRTESMDTYLTDPNIQFLAFELIGSVIPEPGSMVLISLAAPVIALRRRRRL